MGHKSNNKCPHKRKEEGHLIQKRRKEEWATQKDRQRLELLLPQAKEWYESALLTCHWLDRRQMATNKAGG